MGHTETTVNVGIPKKCTLNRQNRGSYWWRQHIAAISANLILLGAGMSAGWTSSAQAVLRGDKPGSPLRLTLEQSSWMSALLPLGALLGALPAGLLADRVGRKSAVLLQAVPEVLGWLLVIFAYDRAWMLLLGRFCIGLTIGSNAVQVCMYCEEIAEVCTRGTIGSYVELASSTGMFISYVLGSFLPYIWYSSLSAVPAVCCLLIFSWMPESPVFLACRGRFDEARQSLLWLRGPNYDIMKELDDLKTTTLKAQCSWTPKSCCSSRLQIDRTMVKTMSIAVGIMFFSEANGKNVFLYYMTDIFRDANSSLKPETASIIVGAVFIAATFLPSLTVDRIGRKPLLAGSFFVMGLCQLFMSVYTHLSAKGNDVEYWRWIPLVALIVFIVAISAGPGALCWFMMMEFIPVKIRSWGVPLVVALGRATVLLLIKEFPVMVVELGQDITYGIFCIVCFFGIGFSVFCVLQSKIVINK